MTPLSRDKTTKNIFLTKLVGIGVAIGFLVGLLPGAGNRRYARSHDWGGFGGGSGWGGGGSGGGGWGGGSSGGGGWSGGGGTSGGGGASGGW